MQCKRRALLMLAMTHKSTRAPMLMTRILTDRNMRKSQRLTCNSNRRLEGTSQIRFSYSRLTIPKTPWGYINENPICLRFLSLHLSFSVVVDRLGSNFHHHRIMQAINIICMVLCAFFMSSSAFPAHHHRRARVQRRVVGTDRGNTEVHIGHLAQIYVPVADEPTRMIGSKGVGHSADRDRSSAESLVSVPLNRVLLSRRWFKQDDQEPKLVRSMPRLDERALITSDMIGAL